jgi:hypothetical protein
MVGLVIGLAGLLEVLQRTMWIVPRGVA